MPLPAPPSLDNRSTHHQKDERVARSSLSCLSYRLADFLRASAAPILDGLILILVVKHLGEMVNCPGIIELPESPCSIESDDANVILESLNQRRYCSSIVMLTERYCGIPSDKRILVLERLDQWTACSRIFEE